MAPERIVYAVPEGWPRMSEPVDAAQRYKQEDIQVVRATEGDLLDMAISLQAAFPEVWWQKHEPPGLREENETLRARQCAERLRPFVSLPNVLTVKAMDAKTGKFMGWASWSGPGFPIHNTFHKSAVPFHGLQEQFGWTDAYFTELWSRVKVESWQGEFEGYDAARQKEMADEPHWYLAPLIVLDEFRGRGVGSLLMQAGTERADAHEPPLKCWLEAFPNARPVYYHFGFEGLEHKGAGYESVMVRPPKAAKTN